MSELWINVCPQPGHTGSRGYTLSYHRSRGKRGRRKYSRDFAACRAASFPAARGCGEGQKKGQTNTGCSNSGRTPPAERRGREKSYIASASGVTSQTRRRHMNNIAPRHIAAFPRYVTSRGPSYATVSTEYSLIGFKLERVLYVSASLHAYSARMMCSFRTCSVEENRTRFNRASILSEKRDQWKSNCRASSFGSQFWASKNK